jgi:magnesium transporter
MSVTLIASIYGMNFKNMPELNHPWGYPIALLSMLLLAGGLILTFRRRGWL